MVVNSAEANLAGSPFDAGDGNLILNDETEDWVNATNRQVGIDLPTGQSDDSLGNGTKEDDPVPSVIDGSIPNNKSDLTRFYVANEKVGGKDFLYLAWERVQEPSGTTNMDFEFNQSEQLSANGVTPVRTAGDVLIKYDLAQGGVNAVLGYHRWVTTGIAAQVCEAANKLPCWDKVHALGGFFEASINQEVVTDPIAPNAPRNLSVRTFGEAAINLTDSNILPSGSCAGFAGAYLKSRSSDSFTAAIKDFIAPIPVELRNCGAIKVTKTRKHAAAGSGDHPHAGVSFTVDGVTKQTDSNGVACWDGLEFGNYTVHETVPAGYSVDANDKSVTVDNAAGCTDATYTGETATFQNTPLTNITVSVNSQVDGGTASTIVCKNAGGTTLGSGSTGSNGDGSVTVSDLPPTDPTATLICTVTVDP